MSAAYEAKEGGLREILTGRQFTAFKAARHCQKPLQYLEQIENIGIRYVSFYDEVYPQKLKQIPDPPFGVFVKGNLPDESSPSVAMIGARACSSYGKAVAKSFGAELAAAGVQVVSGMARGIDSISQQACLESGGHTFAVLGSGVDVCYPGELKGLYEAIQDCGGILSSYAPGMPPVSGNFPPRNRIISGLADLVLVVEARRKSGTLITVDMALEQGKEVAVVPGRITDSLSQGCHDLIKQGARMVLETEQLLELLSESYREQEFYRHKTESPGINSSKAVMLRQQLDKRLYSILEVLTEEPVSPEQLFMRWKKISGEIDSFQDFMGGLMDLELLDLCKSDKNRFSIR